MDVSQRRELNKGLGDGFSRPFEMVLGPAVFGFIGYQIDQWLGTTPIFLIVLALLAVVGVGIKFFYSYCAEMDEHDEERPWAKLP